MTSTISVRNLTKTFGRTRALDGFDLDVTDGEIHGFLGPNGAGKTTTIRILLGMIKPTSGTASVFGLDPWRDGLEIHSRISYVPGDVTLWPSLTGGEVIDVLGRMHGRVDSARRDALLEQFELDPTKRCRTYSKGNRQKVALIAALAADAELLILDEPTSGLDPLMEEVFRSCIHQQRNQGRTVLLSSHILSEVEALCDRVSIIRAGRLVEAAPLSRLRSARQSKITAELGRAPQLDGVLIHDLELEQLAAGTTKINCRVEGADLDELLARLQAATVISLTCTPPSLEEIFLSHYETDPVTA
jgi:ABC-2 type transport system ATP-binding protein